jgi:hypothetical protein
MIVRSLLIAAACWLWAVGAGFAQPSECTKTGIGSSALTADAPASITAVSLEPLADGRDQYCLVGVHVGDNVNILVGLPMAGRWNGDLQAIGRGGYGGALRPPISAVARGYVGVSTDTGHPFSSRDPNDAPTDEWRDMPGAFAMLSPGKLNRALQTDFAYRSSHLMAVIAKQLATGFFGRPVEHAYWYGCSTEGSHGLRAVQQYPEDYDGVLAGDPAIHFAQVMAYQIWPQLVMKERIGGPLLPVKLDLATRRAIATCDALDGLRDGLLTDPRRCRYRAARDKKIVRADCAADNGTCLSPIEAGAIDEIWRGPVTASGRLLWRGIERGAPLSLLAGAKPFPYAIVQPRYWVYLDPAWDWRTLTIATYPAFFAESVAAVSPVMAADNPNLAPFFARGGKIMLYHGFNDAGILPQGSIDYYKSVSHRMRLSMRNLRSQFRLFMLAGVGHCGGGDAPQAPVDRMFDALVEWVEKGREPEGLISVQENNGEQRRSRPVCAYPALPRYKGRGDPNLASSFRCR